MVDPRALNEIYYGQEWAERWDELFGQQPDTAEAVEALARLGRSGPILEFGIGTGRLALPLFEKGLRVHGIDASEAMIAQLRAKPRGNEIPIQIGDFASTKMEERFALVVIADHTLFALADQDEQVRCVENAAHHLHPGGVFVVEAWFPTAEALGNSRVWVGGLQPQSLTWFASRTDRVNQRMEVVTLCLKDGEPTCLVPCASRYVWPAELDLMARLAGLHLRER